MTTVHIEFCTTKNCRFLTEIMQLRYQAYHANNHLTWQRCWKDMRDQWDERSVIVVAKLDDQIVGSVRVTINIQGEQLSYPSLCRSEVLGVVPIKAIDIYPTQYVEASRLCIATHYRGRGLWYLLAAPMIMLGGKTGRQYIVGSAIDDFIPTWSKVGFVRTGHRYFNEDIVGKTHEMMVLNIPEVFQGNCDKNFYQILQDSFDMYDCLSDDVLAVLHRS